jgi:hypothetical protein
MTPAHRAPRDRDGCSSVPAKRTAGRKGGQVGSSSISLEQKDSCEGRPTESAYDRCRPTRFRRGRPFRVLPGASPRKSWGKEIA